MKLASLDMQLNNIMEMILYSHANWVIREICQALVNGTCSQVMRNAGSAKTTLTLCFSGLKSQVKELLKKTGPAWTNS